MMSDGSCQIPCYAEEKNCNLTVVQIFLAKNLESKDDPPVLLELGSIMWHGLSRIKKCLNKIDRFRKWSTGRSNKSNC
jgi:hypothetical protein